MNTELIDPTFEHVDQWTTIEAVEAMLKGQQDALAAIKSQTALIAEAAEAAAERLASNGRLIYVGAGTSGRIAVQDGVELLPTYGWPGHRLVYLMAGGISALVESAEGAEDNFTEGENQAELNNFGQSDVVIGVTASGSTPFTCAAVKAARKKGALTISLSNNANSRITGLSDFGICVETGSEIVAGSTRMKAGTAQKAILNILSTSIMMQRGLVYKGLMVNMRISNAKLLARGQAIISSLANVGHSEAARILEETDKEISPAVLMALGATKSEAMRLMSLHKGNLGKAIATMPSINKSNG